MDEKISLINLIQRIEPEFTPSEKRVASYILKRQNLDSDASVRDIAAAAQVSEATVTRFCKRLGLKGFTQLREVLSSFTVTVAPHPVVAIEEGDDLEDVMDKTFHTFRTTLEDTSRVLDPKELLRAAGAIVEADRVEFFANGASGFMARHAAVRLMSLDIPCTAHDLFVAQLASAKMLRRNDVAFMVTHSGENPDILRLTSIAEEQRATVIVLTSNRRSRMAKRADITLVTAEWDLVPAAEAGPSRLSQFLGLELVVSAVNWYLQMNPRRSGQVEARV